MKNSNIIDYSSLLNDYVGKANIFIGEIKNGNCLIGPKIGKHLCLNCFKKRILSSSFFDKNKYVKAKIRNSKFLESKIKTLNNNSALEFRNIDGKFSLFRMHYIFPIPGCTSCDYEK